jgi:hypothetical protein
VITTPNEQDLADLVADVRAAKEQADTVVLSLHWGVRFVPRVIADYQRAVAQAAFGAGCRSDPRAPREGPSKSSAKRRALQPQ